MIEEDGEQRWEALGIGADRAQSLVTRYPLLR